MLDGLFFSGPLIGITIMVLVSGGYFGNSVVHVVAQALTRMLFLYNFVRDKYENEKKEMWSVRMF